MKVCNKEKTVSSIRSVEKLKSYMEKNEIKKCSNTTFKNKVTLEDLKKLKTLKAETLKLL